MVSVKCCIKKYQNINGSSVSQIGEIISSVSFYFFCGVQVTIVITIGLEKVLFLVRLNGKKKREHNISPNLLNVFKKYFII